MIMNNENNKPHILLIDDEAIALSNLSHVLEKEGYEVTACEDGESGLATMQTTEFDLVLSDVRMPGIDGMEAAKQIRAIDPKNGKQLWQQELSRDQRRGTGGLLGTASGLLFAADGGTLYALDKATGIVYWKTNLGGNIKAAPITYESEGQQRLTIVANSVVFTFGLH